jgi:ClpX C4-type zinc finger
LTSNWLAGLINDVIFLEPAWQANAILRQWRWQLSEESKIQRRAAVSTDARCSFCREDPRKVGPLVEGEGPESTGGVFICKECAELVLMIIAEEKRWRGAKTSEDQAERPTVTVARPTLTHLQQLVRKSVVEHKGALPKESALIWFGYFSSLLAWELLSVKDYGALLELLPDYPNDPVVQRILGRGSVTPGGG